MNERKSKKKITAKEVPEIYPVGSLQVTKGPISNEGGPRTATNILSYSVRLLKTTFNHWVEDKAPQLGAALAYYTVFSLAPIVLVFFAVFGFIYGNSEVVRQEILQQLYSILDRSSAKAVAEIAASTAKPTANAAATVVGIAVALFGASGVFGQLQDALNIIWDVKPKPGKSIVSSCGPVFYLSLWLPACAFYF